MPQIKLKKDSIVSHNNNFTQIFYDGVKYQIKKKKNGTISRHRKENKKWSLWKIRPILP